MNKHVSHPVFQSGIAAVILSKKKDRIFTLFHKSRGSISLPTGTIDPGEKPEVTLVRELKEELDIDVTGFHKLYEIEHSTVKKQANGVQDIHYTTHVFMVTDFEGPIVNNEPDMHSDLVFKSVYELERVNDPVLQLVVNELQLTCSVPPAVSLGLSHWSKW